MKSNTIWILKHLNKRLYVSILFVLLLYFYWHLSDLPLSSMNQYDAFIVITKNIFTITYVIIPLYIILLATTIRWQPHESLFMLKFPTRLRYLQFQLQRILMLTFIYFICIVSSLTAVAFFMLNRANRWSNYATENHSPFILQLPPILYVIMTYLLFFCLLLFVGFLFITTLLLFKRSIAAILVSFLFAITNIALLITQLKGLSDYTFFTFLVVDYFADHFQITSYPLLFSSFFYWFLLMTILFFVSKNIVETHDFSVKVDE